MTPEELEDAAARPRPGPWPGAGRAERAHGRRLAAIHDMYRAELAAVAGLMQSIEQGDAAPQTLAPAVAGTDLARNVRQFGTACGRDCALLMNHHDIEETWMFPPLEERGGDLLAPVMARLRAEHRVIHDLIEELHAAAENLVSQPRQKAFADCAARFAALDRAVRSHFGYEETVLEEPLGALRVPI
ncbi:hemerythrin domain-containing protein [Paracoccus beibuensis]|uniref:hemerythrin domain-containing protein n=1 Tax=Paracoccus beibuensis TaxID=547602 RepID=UPI00223F9D91|nr:hemerythrin domain-containing protein [Paracoccus beibuensis]